ncbi:hypothetical protein Srot_0258 [Segniliparus rotundus DSM 44985]|uniref:Uncharacterized protein n=1 Tax=Segniliparus rotundus (strain ATCC BAA-972 / CDC 1076 / CIP 108378 / DSM 44985 / JCM 13578) TaxID=640132 RepID=D6ZAY6_SEGRD|nr:hypothetical protein [Segniliparus rotundus]ADG96745.1 hypothetical protein Srot_0258 [Segniliparus rotundus DSM 44985]
MRVNIDGMKTDANRVEDVGRQIVATGNKMKNENADSSAYGWIGDIFEAGLRILEVAAGEGLAGLGNTVVTTGGHLREAAKIFEEQEHHNTQSLANVGDQVKYNF